MTAPSSAPPSLQAGVIVICDADGELVARKLVPAADAARLRHEVEVLGHLHGLDVVALASAECEVRQDGRHAWVDLVHLDATQLADALDGAPARLLAALASVARTMVASHARGVSHGRLDRTHILLVGSRTVVCGWSDAGVDLTDNHPTTNGYRPEGHATENRFGDGHPHPGQLSDSHAPDGQRPDWPAIDHSAAPQASASHDVAAAEPASGDNLAGGETGVGRWAVRDGEDGRGSEHSGSHLHGPGDLRRTDVDAWTAAPFDPVSDVAALGELCFVAAQHRALTGRMRTQLTAVATIARHPDPTVRPPMSELARVLSRQDPGDPNSGEIRSAAPSVRGRLGARWLTKDTFAGLAPPKLLLGGASAVMAAVLTTVVLADGSANVATGPNPTTSSAAPSEQAAATGDPATARVTGQATGEAGESANPAGGGTPALTDTPCPTTAEALTLVGLPRRCLESLGVSVNDNLVNVGALQYEVGNPEDRVTLSDPACEDKLVAVLLQPADGSVYIYDQWASANQPSSARPLGRVPGASRFTEAIQLVCGPVSVVGPDGMVTDVGGESR